MTSILFTTQNELEAWLAEHNYFFEGNINQLQPQPQIENAIGTCPDEVSFELRYRSNKNFYAGTNRTYFRTRCEAQGVTQWYVLEHAAYKYERGYDYLSEIDLNKSEDSIALIIDEDIHLHCKSMLVQDLPELVEVILPRLSGREVCIKADRPLSTPTEWVTLFRSIGCDVTWRRLGDVGISSELVPKTEYDGWFLQETERVSETQYGLMFKYVNDHSKNFRVVVEAWSESSECSPRLWKSLSAAAGKFPSNLVNCGNCLLTDNEWFTALELGAAYLETLNFSGRALALQKAD